MKSTDVTILFLSCDKYSDLWEPLFYSFHKHWKNCPYPVYLGSNTVSGKDKTVKTLLSGPDKDWSSSSQRILDQIKTPYVFIWLDDIFPTAPVQERDFIDVIAFMKRMKAKHMHVEPKPVPDKILEDGKFGEYGKGAPYRVTAFGFWEVAALKALLLAGESPWNFEIMGSYRSSYSDGYYCTMKNILPRMNMVEKGKYFREAYDYALHHNLPIAKTKRPILESGSYIKSNLKKYYFNFMIKVPWNIRVSVMNIFRKVFISY